MSKPREIIWTNATGQTINVFNWVLGPLPPFNFSNFDQSSCADIGSTPQLLPGQSCSFEAIFAPVSPGHFEGEIVFSYYFTDPSQPQFVTVSLRGNGR